MQATPTGHVLPADQVKGVKSQVSLGTAECVSLISRLGRPSSPSLPQGRTASTAFNVVRFRVKPGHEQKFIDEHRKAKPDFPGFRRGAFIKTGERTYCFIGEWDDYASVTAAEERMVRILDRFRDTLEDLGGGLGVTDPVSGEVVLELKP
jgi:hypothetical protein